MISFLLKMLGDPNEKKVKNIMGIIDHINSLEPEFEKLSDEELRAKTEEFKSILAKRPTSDNEKLIEFLKSKLLIRYFQKLLQLCERLANVCSICATLMFS